MTRRPRVEESAALNNLGRAPHRAPACGGDNRGGAQRDVCAARVYRRLSLLGQRVGSPGGPLPSKKVAPFLFAGDMTALLVSVLAGAALMALSIRRGPVRSHYGSWDRMIA